MLRVPSVFSGFGTEGSLLLPQFAELLEVRRDIIKATELAALQLAIQFLQLRHHIKWLVLRLQADEAPQSGLVIQDAADVSHVVVHP